MKRITIVCILLLFVSSISYAQRGYLDKTFGNKGVVTILHGPGEHVYPMNVSILPDGKIMHAGWMTFPPDLEGLYVMRHHSDGRVDSSFGVNGYRIYPRIYSFSRTYTYHYPDGRCLVYGDQADRSGVPLKPFIMRLLADGRFDDSFGEGGFYTASIVQGGYFTDLKVFSDGSIAAIGACIKIGNSHGNILLPIIARITPSGKNDSSFAHEGVKVVGSESDTGYIYDAIVYQNNKCVFSFSLPNSTSAPMRMLMTDMSGNVDSSQWVSGRVTQRLSDARDFIVAMKETRDGKLVCAAGVTFNGKAKYVLTRFSTKGTIDNSFGEYGVAPLPGNVIQPTFDQVFLDSSDNIIQTGYLYDSTTKYHPALVHYHPDGTFDSSYSGTGVSTELTQYMESIMSVAVASDGKYLIAGYKPTGTDHRFYGTLCRVNNTHSTSIKPHAPLTNSISLHPTPSTDNCTVTYTLPNSSDCTMTLRDESGREVRTFMTSGYRTAGKHEEELDLRGLAAGVYFLQIESGGTTQTVKLIKQ